LQEISIGSPDKAEALIELALAEETAAPALREALETIAMGNTDPDDMVQMAQDALAKAEGGAATNAAHIPATPAPWHTSRKAKVTAYKARTANPLLIATTT
jgi:hypothetical protein